MNNITSLYRTESQWNSIAGPSLDGSNQLSLKPIPKISYQKAQNQQVNKGAYGALISAVTAGVEKKPLTVALIDSWVELTLDEMKANKVLNKDDKIGRANIESLVNEINEKISQVDDPTDTINIVSILGDIAFEIESKNIFAPIQRRVSHLIMNYLLSCFKKPLIVFRAEEKDIYQASTYNPLKMRILLAEKIRDTVLVQGTLFHKVGGQYSSEWYKRPGSLKQKDLIIEWHDLMNSVNQWKREIA